MPEIIIGNRAIGPGHRVYVIAEIGFNHQGKVELGAKMIRAAAAAGVDAVKFQTFKADQLTLRNFDHFDLIRNSELDLGAHKELANVAADEGVTFFSTPFSAWAVDILETVGVPAYKIASMDVTNLPLIRLVAGTGKPVIMSTGMATLDEIATAVETIKAAQAAANAGLALMHCVSLYPAEPEAVNLKTMDQIAGAFGLPVGFSDHLLGNEVALAAVARGAALIEKHFTTDKGLPGPDHKLSADPAEMKDLVQSIRKVEKSLGRPAADDRRPDRSKASDTRRSLFAARNIAAGTIIGRQDVKCVRPERGLPPGDIESVLGRPAKTDIGEEEPITGENV